MNRTRAIVLRVPDHDPGMLFVNGRQLPFSIQGHWRCAAAPAPNLPVDAWLDAAGNLLFIESAAPPDPLASVSSLLPQARNFIDRMGRLPFFLAVALWVTWFFLPVFRISLVKFLGVPVIFSWTAWETLGLYRSPESIDQLSSVAVSSHGFGSLLALAAMTLPFLAPFWPRTRALLFNGAPLAFLIAATMKVQWDVIQAQRTATELAAGNVWAMKLAQDLGARLNQAVSIELGGYLIVLLSFALAVTPLLNRTAPAYTPQPLPPQAAPLP